MILETAEGFAPRVLHDEGIDQRPKRVFAASTAQLSGIVAVDNGRAVVGAGDRQAVEDVQVPSRGIFLKRPGACERV